MVRDILNTPGGRGGFSHGPKWVNRLGLCGAKDPRRPNRLKCHSIGEMSGSLNSGSSAAHVYAWKCAFAVNVSGEDNRSNNWVQRIKRRPMTVIFNTSRKRKNLRGRTQAFPPHEIIIRTVGQLGRMFGGTRPYMRSSIGHGVQDSDRHRAISSVRRRLCQPDISCDAESGHAEHRTRLAHAADRATSKARMYRVGVMLSTLSHSPRCKETGGSAPGFGRIAPSA